MTEPNRDLDNAAWLVAVVREYEGPLVRYAQRLLDDGHRTQTWLRTRSSSCAANREKEIAGRLRPGCTSVCRHRAMDVLKKEQRMTTLTEPQAPGLASRVRSVGDLERQETFGQATAILAGLPANEQEVIRLKVLDGLSYREISGVGDGA